MTKEKKKALAGNKTLLEKMDKSLELVEGLEDEGEEESFDNEEIDLDSMSFQKMLNYIEEEKFDLGLSKKAMKSKAKVKAALKRRI